MWDWPLGLFILALTLLVDVSQLLPSRPPPCIQQAAMAQTGEQGLTIVLCGKDTHIEAP